MRFPYRSKNHSTISAPSAEPADISSIPRLRARSSLDRFTVSKNRTRLPSSTSSQPEPMGIQTAQDLLTAASSRTPGRQGFSNYSYPYRPNPASPTTKEADVLVSLRAEVRDEGSAGGDSCVKSQATTASASESCIDMRDRERRPGWALRRERTLVEAGTYDGGNSASEETRVPDSASLSRRDFSGSSSSSEGLDIAKSIEEYNLLAREHGLKPLEFGLAEVANEVELTSEAKHHVPKILRKSSSLNKIVIFTTKHFQKKASAADLHKDTLKGKTLQELSLTGVATLKLPPEFAVGELILPTFLCNLATFLYNEGRTAPGIFRVSGQYHHIYDLYNYYASQYPKASEAKKIQKAAASTSLPVHLKHEVNDVAALFTKVIRGLPGGLLGSLSLFNAFSSIEAKFRTRNKASAWKESPNLVKVAEKKSVLDLKRNPAQAKLIALAISSIISPYRKSLVIGFLGLAAIIGYETEQAYADPFADTSELMTYHSLGVVLGPVLLGDRMFVVDSATPKIKVKDESSDESDNSRSTPSKLYVPVGVSDLKDHAMVTASVMEMLITVWRDVITQLREIEQKGVGPYARIWSRVTSGQSEYSSRLSGVEEDPQLEEQLKPDQDETTSTQGSVQDEAANLGIRKQRWRDLNGTTASSGCLPCYPALKDNHRPHIVRPFIDHPDEYSEQDDIRSPSIISQDNRPHKEIENDRCTVANGETPSPNGAQDLNNGNREPRYTWNPSLKQSDPASDRPASSNESWSQLSLQDGRTPSVKVRPLTPEEVSQPAQDDTNGRTESALTSEKFSSAQDDNRRWGVVKCESHYTQEVDSDAEEALVRDLGEDKASSSQILHAQNADGNSSEHSSSQETPMINHNSGTEATHDIGTQALTNQSDEDHPASFNAGYPTTEADISNFKRQNSVKRIARKFEASQRQGGVPVKLDTPLSIFSPSVNISLPNAGPKKQMRVPIASRIQGHELPTASSPPGTSQIPKPVFGRGHGRTSEGSSPSPAKTVTPGPCGSGNLVSSSDPLVNGEPSPRSSIPPPTTRTSLSAPLGAKMRSLSSYATPSLERIRSRNNEHTSAATATLQSHTVSTTSLRLEHGLSLLHSHGTSPLAPPRVASLVNTTGAKTSLISQPPAPESPRKDPLPRKQPVLSQFDSGPLPTNTTRTLSSWASAIPAANSPPTMRSLTNGQPARNTKPKFSSAASYGNRPAPGSQHTIVSEMVRQLQEQVHDNLLENKMAKCTAMSVVRERLAQARLAESVWKLHAGFLENLLLHGVQEGECVAKIDHAGGENSESEELGAIETF